SQGGPYSYPHARTRGAQPCPPRERGRPGGAPGALPGADRARSLRRPLTVGSAADEPVGEVAGVLPQHEPDAHEAFARDPARRHREGELLGLARPASLDAPREQRAQEEQERVVEVKGPRQAEPCRWGNGGVVWGAGL